MAPSASRFSAPDLPPLDLIIRSSRWRISGKSVAMRAQEPAQINPNGERVAVKLQWNAAAKVKLEIQITERFVVNTGVESVVAHKVRGANGNAGRCETLAVFGRAASIAFG